MGAYPLVSIIIPVYNAEKWVEQSYTQATRQTYSNIEIVYIDNASTDSTAKILQTLADKDSRVKVCFEQQKGAGAARNKGIDEASGEILSFLDVDDEIHPEKIERHNSILESNPNVHLVYSKELKKYDDKSKSFEIPRDPGPPGVKQARKLGLHILEHFGRMPGMSSISCRKRSAQSVGSFQSNLLRGEDSAFVVKMALKFNCYFDDFRVGTYHRHSESTTSQDNSQLKGNPYYYQFKTFYLPYFNSEFSNPRDTALQRWISRKTSFELFLNARSRFTNHIERRAYLFKEVNELELNPRHNFLIKLIAQMQDPLQRLAIKIWAKFSW